MDNLNIVFGILLLTLGTFALRLAGPYMRQYLSRFPEFEGFANELSQILLFSLAVTAALFEASQFAGFARLIGFLVAVILVYKKAPFIMVVVSAAITTALLRLFGID